MSTFDTHNPPTAESDSLRRRFVRGGALLAGGHVGAKIFALVRLAILARILGPEEFGLASLLILTLAMIEMISNLSFEKAIIRANDEQSHRLQSSAQLLCVGRGVLLAIALFLIAGPATAFLGISESAPMLRLLAIAPLITGLAHLEPKRLQRELRYMPDVSIELVSQAIVTLFAWPIAIWLDSALAAVWLIVGRAFVHTLATHIVSKSPYRWSIDRASASHLMIFGAPLVANGVLYFAIMQGDQLVIGKLYGLSELGLYAAVFGLISAPTIILAKISVSLFLPVYARQLADDGSFERTHALASRGLGLVALTLAGGATALGVSFVTLAYGNSYAPGIGLVIAIAIMQSVRILRIAPTVAAIAHGDTANAMFANLFRISMLPIAIWLAGRGAPLMSIALCGALGEVLALAFTSWRLARKDHLKPATDRSVAICISIVLACVIAVSLGFDGTSGPIAALVALSIGIASLLVRWQSLRDEIIRSLSHTFHSRSRSASPKEVAA